MVNTCLVRVFPKLYCIKVGELISTLRSGIAMVPNGLPLEDGFACEHQEIAIAMLSCRVKKLSYNFL